MENNSNESCKGESMLKCIECSKPVLEVLSCSEMWQKLWNIVDTLDSEENITPATTEMLRQTLCYIKGPLIDYDESRQKQN